MSGICGIFNLDGAPVDRAILERMTAAIAHRGPDGIHHAIDGNIGLGHCMLCTTPESLHERQPLYDESGQYCLAMDGRIDNREELTADLKAKGAILRDDTDAELVLKSYITWKEDSPHRLIGDFAYVIYDKPRQQLFCARDHLGIKPLYYAVINRSFVCASELHALFAHPAVPKRLNEGVVAEYLAFRITSLEETLYRDIFKSVPASSLSITAGEKAVRRYWNPDDCHPPRYRRDEEYVEHFREILQLAVSCRLRSHTRVGAELSGGLDSSTVVLLGARMLQRTAKPMRTYSLIFPGHGCDESEYITSVLERCHAESFRTVATRYPAEHFRAQASRYADIPDYATIAMGDGLRRAARASGSRVMLTGYGGDQWLTGSELRHADLVRRLRFRSAFHQFRIDQDLEWLPAGTTFFRCAIRPLMPAPLVRVARALKRRQGVRPFPWLAEEFVASTQLNARLENRRRSAARSLTRRDLTELVFSGWLLHGFEMIDRNAASFALEYRHPFYDSRLIEFAISIPEDLRWRGITKYILRKAMTGIFPDKLLKRRSKADFGHVVVEALEAFGGEATFEGGASPLANWIVQPELSAIYRKMIAKYAEHKYTGLPGTWQLWLACAMSTWFENNFSSSDRLMLQKTCCV